MTTAKLFRYGQHQAIRIPMDFEFKGVNEVSIRKEGNRIVIEPLRKTWLSYAKRRGPMQILCQSGLSLSINLPL